MSNSVRHACYSDLMWVVRAWTLCRSRSDDEYGRLHVTFSRSSTERRPHRSHLYHADRSVALVLGRPIAIQDVYTSTHPPSNVDDFVTSDLRKPLPLTTPTPSTFMILRHTDRKSVV